MEINKIEEFHLTLTFKELRIIKELIRLTLLLTSEDCPRYTLPKLRDSEIELAKEILNI